MCDPKRPYGKSRIRMVVKLAEAAVQKIKRQGELNTPEDDVLFAIFEQAVLDLFCTKKHYQLSARHYLDGPLTELEAVGVEPAWVRCVLKECGIPAGSLQ